MRGILSYNQLILCTRQLSTPAEESQKYPLDPGMGSTEGSSGADQEQWWQSSALAPTDLRQHADSWNLAGDAATATLLQSISQRLVSRTHEVEGMLQKVLEETDRVSAMIFNTSNSFHMLANTQFIENRTYQDDADVAKSKAPEVKTKMPVSEEEVIGRCKAAIVAGIDLVNRSYEKHVIQDSESEDEDGHDSPVPIYALIDPYENKPLPYIIGTQLFMQDDRIGLQDPSSEENSKATMTPEDTDSEEESDLEAKKNKPIPASSSKIIEDESDSDLSDESLSKPTRNHIQNNIRHSLSSSADEEEEEEEEEEDDLFKPPTKSTPKITNNGPSLANELNKKFGNNTAAATVSSKKGGIGFDDSESDEDGDLFGKRPETSSDLFGKSSVASVTKGEDRRDSAKSRSSSLTAPVGKSKTGVENVRAMPDPARVHKSSKGSTTVKKDLFASESEDEEDLFSSKPRSQSRTSTSSNKTTVKVPIPSSQLAPPKTSSGGLFSSDGDEEEDNSGLFGTNPTVSQDNEAAIEDEAKEKSPALAKSGRKVPVGGVNIFGSAITTALRRQQSPDTDESEEDSDWSEPSKSSEKPQIPKAEVPVPSPAATVTQKPEKQATIPERSTGGGGLFDDDDDDDLFGAAPKKAVSVTSKANVGIGKHTSAVSAPSNTSSTEKLLGNTVVEDKLPLPSKTTTSHGLFSDDDDDLFSGLAVKEQRPSTLSVNQKVRVSANVNEQAAPQNTSTDNVRSTAGDTNKISVTSAVKVPESTKQPSSLFSSPSDDELFTPARAPQAARPSVPVIKSEPPPLPPTNVTKATSNLFGSPSDDDDLFAVSETVTSKPEKTESSSALKLPVGGMTENVKEKPPPVSSNNIFSSPSDDDIFSFASSASSKTSKVNLESAAKDVKDPASDAKNGKSSLGPSKSETKKTPSDDLFASKEVNANPTNKTSIASTKPAINQPKLADSKPKQDLFASTEDEDEDIFSNLVPKSDKKSTSTLTVPQNKKVNLFDSPESEDDIFSVVTGSSNKLEEKPLNAEKTKVSLLSESTSEEDIFGTAIPQIHKQEDKLPSAPVVPLPVDRESPPPLSLVNETQSNVEHQDRKETSKPPFKPPVGGVALFGGDALAAKISERKSTVDETSKGLDKTAQKEKNVTKDNQLIFSENDERGTDIFGADDINDDDIFGSDHVAPSITGNLVNQTGPPPLPSEVEVSGNVKKSKDTQPKISLLGQTEDVLFTESQPKERDEIFPDKPKEIVPANEKREESIMKSDFESESRDTSEKPKQESRNTPQDQNQESRNTSEEQKPKKKAPVGGISLFGGGGIGSSELFAKVKQRKSMLAPESDEDEVDNVAPSASKKESSENPVTSKPTSSSSSGSVTPISPLSAISPVKIGTGASKSTSVESGVSFEDPASSTSVLQSVNKTRARGSVKRRPPSRAHRRGESTPTASSSSVSATDPVPAVVQDDLPAAAVQKSEEKNTTVTSSVPVANTVKNLPEPVSKTKNVHVKKAEKNPLEDSKITKSNPSNAKKNTGNILEDGIDDDDLFSKPRSASSTSKSSSSSKKLGQSQPPSLFGDNDSDDDLFGASKSKSSSGSASKAKSNLAPAKEVAAKPAAAPSLFGDDDDDIFTSVSKSTVASSSAPKKIPSAKPKGNLKPSSEPFNDPLLGNMK